MPTSSSKIRFSGAAAIGLLVAVSAVCVICAICLLSGIDAWLVEVTQPNGLPGDLKKLISSFEIFGHGTGVLVVALLVRVLDQDGFRRSIYVLTSGFLSGLVVICVKPFVTRVRPSKLETLIGGSSRNESLIGFPWSTTGSSETTDAVHGFFHDAIHSFPSGHTATACALALCLSRLYPSGRFVFWAFAILVAVQRLFAQAHYLSDAIAGALVGVLVGSLVVTLLDRFWLTSGNSVRSDDQNASMAPK